MKLMDWLPHDADIDTFPNLEKFMYWEVVEQYGYRAKDKVSPFTHKFIFNWCVIKRGKKSYAVGWNENPSIGWSFPIKLIKEI